MRETTTFNCSADSYAFGYVCAWSSGSEILLVLQSSGAFCNSSYCTLCFCWSSILGGSPTCFKSLNLSVNRACHYSSGLDFSQHFNLSFHFCILSGNTPANCLFFEVDILHSSILCLSLFNNSCQSDRIVPGLIYLNSTLTFSNCVFQLNAFDYFLGTYSSDTISIILIRCVFDFESPNATRDVSFYLTDCLLLTQVNLPVQASKCPWPDATATQNSTLTESPTPTQSPIPTQSPLAITINATSQGSISLSHHSQIVMTISSNQTFVIFPSFSHLSAIVYNSKGRETDKFSSPTNVFAVYFSSKSPSGKIHLTATAPTILKYFSVRFPWDCQVYYLSSAPNEQWSANAQGGNFTIDNSQNVCLFHVSDNLTSIVCDYDLELGADKLNYQYSGKQGYYTGTNRDTALSYQFTAFYWRSNSMIVSNYFSIQLTSPSSSLPYRNCVGTGESSSPLLQKADVPLRTRSSHATRTSFITPSSSPVPTTVSSIEEGVKLGLSLGAIVGIVIGSLLVVAFVCFVAWRLKRKDKDVSILTQPFKLPPPPG